MPVVVCLEQLFSVVEVLRIWVRVTWLPINFDCPTLFSLRNFRSRHTLDEIYAQVNDFIIIIGYRRLRIDGKNIPLRFYDDVAHRCHLVFDASIGTSI